MKLLFVLSLGFAHVAFSAPCDLAKPIPLSEKGFSERLLFNNVTTSEPVKFMEGLVADKGSDLFMDIFYVKRDYMVTDIVGVRVETSRTMQGRGIGSADDYIGNLIDLKGSVIGQDGGLTFSMTNIQTTKTKTNELRLHKYETAVKVVNGYIVSIKISEPVKQVVYHEPGYTEYKYTGEQQDIWVCSATVINNL